MPSGDSERVASRPFFGRLATIKRAVGGGPERPVSKRRSAVEPTREGAFPPYYGCMGRGHVKTREKGGLARFLRPVPEATETSRKASFQSPEGCPEGARRKARSVTGRGSGTGEAELGRREVAARRSGAKGG